MLRLASQRTSIRASSLLFSGFKASVARNARSIATERITAANEQQILVEQRKNRPMSPHLDIYQPQLTWYLSGLHRVTGVALAGGFLGGLVSYTVLPLIGYPFTFAELADLWSTVPGLVKVATKSAIAFPFSFHAWNGIRHLLWDAGKELSLKGVYRTGYAVLGLTVVSSVGLALL